MKIREAVEIRTHQPKMSRDNGYDLPAIYDNILHRPSQGIERAHMMSPTLKKASDGQKLGKTYKYAVSSTVKLHVV